MRVRCLLVGVAALLVMASTALAPAAQAATESWTSQTSGTSKTLFAIDMISPTTGLAVGASGTILRTTDGGAHWAPVDSGTSADLHGVTGFSFGCGSGGNGPCFWVDGAGGTIRFSSDGGSTWCAQTS